MIISGFAGNPGKIEFDRPTTVYQAIMEAGGVSDYGSLSNIHLTRIINGAAAHRSLNLRPTIHGEPIRPTVCPGRRRDLHRAQLVLIAVPAERDLQGHDFAMSNSPDAEIALILYVCAAFCCLFCWLQPVKAMAQERTVRRQKKLA